MSIDMLLAEVRQNRPEAQATAARIGPAASPSLAELATDPDVEVRSLALRCLSISGGPAAAEAAMKALSDEEDEVVAQALQVLHAVPPRGCEGDLLRLFGDPPSAAVREEAPLIAGRLAPEVDPSPWADFWQIETDEFLRERLMVGLARMGHEPARQDFVRRLQSCSGPDVIPWLDHARYMQDPWILPHLAPLLERAEEALQLMPDGPTTWPLRTSDLAARAIVEIAGASVDFDIYRPTPFTPQELEQVRRIALQGGR